MKNKIVWLFLMTVSVLSVKGQGYETDAEIVKLDNPITVHYIKTKIKK